MKKLALGKLYKELFYIPKHEKLTEKVFRCRMAVSLLTILACVAVMTASTFALFYTDVSTDNSTIASAYYSVSLDNADNGVYISPLAYEDKHTFEIKADGTATTGYCKIQIGEQTYYTEQIPQGKSLILSIQAAKGTEIIFTPGWGTQTETTCGNEIIHSATPHTVYTVEPTARLSSIAAHYGVTEEDILVYNNLLAVAVDEENAAPLLSVGMDLKIPNPDKNAEPYQVPYATYIVEPTATLDAISYHYGISVEDICAFNDMTAYSVGMSLKIPNADPTLPDYAVPYTTYIVEPTAILENIAAYYGVSETDILLYNNISEISVNMPLNIPGVSDNVTPYAVPFATYTIEATATLEGISEYYGISVVDIVMYNGNVNMTAGNIIKIPGVSPDTPSYVAPVPEAALLTASDNDFILTSNSTITLDTADILLYKGNEYQKGLDLRITGIEAVADINNKTGEYFCTLLTSTETLSLCLEITENIENGYLKVIIGESEYYIVQIKKDAYIRLDITAPVGTEIRFEAYEGIPIADILYGDDLKDDTDGNNPLLNHTLLTTSKTATLAQTEQSTVGTTIPAETTVTEQISSETTTEVTIPTVETPVDTTTENTTPIVDTPAEETTAMGEVTPPAVEATTEDITPTDEMTTTEQPTAESPTVEETTSGGDSTDGEQPTEDPALTGDDVPTEDGATE